MYRQFVVLLAIVLWSAMMLPLPKEANAETALSRAVVQNLRNLVRLIPKNRTPRPARLSDAMTPGDALSTGRSSLAELRFNDGSLARVGEQAVFRFLAKTRNFSLSNGTVLLLIPPGRGTTGVKTPNAAAAIRGSALFVRYIPDTDTTIVGALTDSEIRVFNKSASQSQVLEAGQMAVIVNDKIENLYEFDLNTFYETSDLVQELNLNQEDGAGANPADPAIASVQAETAAAAAAQPPITGEGVIENPDFVKLPASSSNVTNVDSNTPTSTTNLDSSTPTSTTNLDSNTPTSTTNLDSSTPTSTTSLDSSTQADVTPTDTSGDPPVNSLTNILVDPLDDTPDEILVDTVVDPLTDTPAELPTDTPVESLVESPVEPLTDIPTDTLVESPAESPPTDAPVEPPTDTPVESPVEPPTDAPVEPPTDAPVEPPTDTPVESPTDALVEPPTDTPVESPVEPPTDTPVESPTDTPVESPTDAPVEPPTDTPVEPPTDAPVESPTDTPVESPTDTPVEPPTDTPVEPPTDTPVESPTDTPVESPTDAPVESPTDTPVEPPTDTPETAG